ncbi:MAG: hypothetical protein ACLFST_14660 [Spirochaetia bacterium]
MILQEKGSEIIITCTSSRFRFSKISGSFIQISCYDDKNWYDLLPDGKHAGLSVELPVHTVDFQDKNGKELVIDVVAKNDHWRLEKKYEVFSRGYIICTFTLDALRDHSILPPAKIQLPLKDVPVFMHQYKTMNITQDFQDRSFPRALSIDFSTDERPVTNSVNLLLEYPYLDVRSLPCRKELSQENGHRTLGWELSRKTFTAGNGFKYSNRWALTVTGVNGNPNPVRGQRIYHWYGHYPPFPSDDHITEMAEYGCTYLVLHMPSFRHITGNEPADPVEMVRVIRKAHESAIKILFYCQPYLLSKTAPYHSELSACRTENLDAWNSMKNTKIVFYALQESYDCDEVCLRCSQAYNFMYNSPVNFLRRYNADGFYVDGAWPPIGICNDPSHGHKPGLYNFYDYLKLIRSWRKFLGDRIMIGHAGSISVSSDFIEGFDGCLTGEAQGAIEAHSLKIHYGLPSTLWAMHRRKEESFRGPSAVPKMVREGTVPHVGQGIIGTSILATLDPAYHKDVLPLWQMLRAFPVQKSRFYNYLTKQAVSVDNPDIAYSLYVTDTQREALLILSNGSGEKSRTSPSVGGTVRIDLSLTGLPEELNGWLIRGNSYETVRTGKTGPVKKGMITIHELGIHETVACVLFSDSPPKEFSELIFHLQGRWQRLPDIFRDKIKRLKQQDECISNFNRDFTGDDMTYTNFMKDRTME